MKKFCMLLLFLLTALPCRAEGLEWITMAENAYLPDADALAREYPASVVLGEPAYDQDTLLAALLGSGYYAEERSEFDSGLKYRSSEGEEPWEYRSVTMNDDGSLWYYNPWITGERGGEYEAPRMSMLPDESLVLCRALLKDVVPEDWLSHASPARGIRDRWDYSDRWMTDEEYAAWCRQQDTHYFIFHPVTEAGLPVLSQQLMAGVGMDGLSMMDVNWRSFTESVDTIAPMPLDEALAMANSTREAHCTLLYAGLGYSNWLTENETQNLCWYLVTDAGNYVVDCVLRQHKCDSYEY